MSLRFLSCVAVAGAASAGVVLAGCSCAAACLSPSSTILNTEGFVVVAVDSSCGNSQTVLPGQQVQADVLAKKATCHFDITLDDGETIAFDVPFTKDTQSCCCGNCMTVEAADWSPPTISAPPGYAPHLDGGADASEDGLSD